MTNELFKSEVTDCWYALFSLSVMSLPPHWGPAAAPRGCPLQTESGLSPQHYPW